MKVEIWSDVVCPFCYIGKHKFGKALERFSEATEIEVVWKSFLLNPDEVTQPGVSALTHLAESKEWTEEYTRGMFDHVIRTAADAGLVFNLDDIQVANTFRAHRLIQFAKSRNEGSRAGELLFRAYFTEGKNIDDTRVLVSVGEELGFSAEETTVAVNGTEWDEFVHTDLYEARQIGVRGVPYFVFNDRYALSGAQPEEVFLGALEKAFSEFRKA
jgi:predicted DsbA family dithiol-disulfide isomerase